ncbi:MAG TPA: hypothetical protein VLV32_03280 [Burkholderiales bacterium]|nr:hypothetical protein [Burkholderiales bacterium]
MSNVHARLMTAVVTVAFLIGVPSLVLAEPDGGSPHEGMQHWGAHCGTHAWQHHGKHHAVDHVFHSLFRHAKDLGLSDEQVAKLHSLKTGYAKAEIRGEADMKLAEVDVRTLAHDPKAKMSTVEDAVRKEEMAHADRRIEKIKTLRATFAVLTPEQLEKWRAMRLEGHGGWHRERYGEGADFGTYSDKPGTARDETS